MKGQDWTNEELEKLREHYGKMINKELQEKYLPNRTENAIRRKASELGITLAQKSAWTEEELEILREYYGKISNERLQRQYLPKLFDKGLITFNKYGEILLSSQIRIENIKRLGLSQGMRFDLQISKSMEGYLSYHRDVLFVE